MHSLWLLHLMRNKEEKYKYCVSILIINNKKNQFRKVQGSKVNQSCIWVRHSLAYHNHLVTITFHTRSPEIKPKITGVQNHSMERLRISTFCSNNSWRPRELTWRQGTMGRPRSTLKRLFLQPRHHCESDHCCTVGRRPRSTRSVWKSQLWVAAY